MRFRFKITLGMLCLLAVLFAAGSSLLIGVTFADSQERERNSAVASYNQILSTLRIASGIDSDFGAEDAPGILEQMASQSDGEWQALRLSCEGETLFEQGAFAFPDSQEGPRDNYCMLQTSTEDDGRHMLAVTGSFSLANKPFELRIAKDVTYVYTLRDSLIDAYQIAFCVLMLLGALFSFAMATLLTRQLSRLSQTSRAIAEGDLSVRSNVSSNDEVGQLAKDFDQMAESIEKSMGELEDAMERQERFVGSFAHEVRTPMTSIVGYSDLVRSGQLSESETAQALGYMSSEAKRLERLSKRLLELQVVGKDEIELVPRSPSSLVQELVSRIQPLYRSDGIKVDCTCEPGTCLLEPDLVRTMLVNLVENSRRAIGDEGGTIDIECAMLPDGCSITVRDDGCGIPAESLARLTDAFYRVDKARSRKDGGAGLGLSLCEEIAAAHNGSMHFESEPGKGCAVTVFLKGGLQ